MAYSDNFPAVRPVFQADFANGGKIDPRATFSRASTANVFDGAKHLSSDNLLLQSSSFDTTWSHQGLTSITSGQTDPSGGTSGFTLLEDSATAFHRIYQSTTATGELALTVYAKRNAGSRYLNLSISTSASSTGAGLATFDLAGGATHTDNGASSTLTNLSATQTASGNGYYKCVFKATATGTTSVNISLSDIAAPVSNNYGLVLYAGNGTSSIDLAFASLSSVNSTEYVPTTTQIARSYAPSLVSKANNAARFEVGVDGQSMGVLIESQATNLIPNSSGINSWVTKGNVTITDSAAVGPDGTLSASLVRPTGATSLQHYIRENITTVASSSYTFSAYVKPAGYTKLLMVSEQTAHPYTDYANATFTLTGAGSVTTSAGSATITALSDGWYKITATGTAATTGSYALLSVLNDAGDLVYTADSYSGIIITGVQFELGSFASSLIATSGATATRALDSLSVVDSSLFDNGSGALAAEYDMFAATETSYLLHIEKSSGGTNGGGISVTNRYLGVESNYLDLGNTTSNVFHKVAASWETGSQKMSRDGGAASEDTSTVIPSGTDKLFIGVRQDGGEHVNGHIKRLAIYSEPLSSTNLQALTS